MTRSKRDDDTTKDLYKKVRKPVPPPGRVEEDRRRKLRDEQAERETERESEEAP